MKKLVSLFLYLLFFSPLIGQNVIKPLGVALVIGDQFKDPLSYMVEVTPIEGVYNGNEGEPQTYYPADFHNLVILLKSWSIPFDIYRLDQQFLDINMFLGPDNKPKYGTIIWAVNKSESLLHPDMNIISNVLKNNNMGFIAVADNISQPEIQALLGIVYEGEWRRGLTDMNTTSTKHYITNGLTNPLNREFAMDRNINRVNVKVENAEVVATHGNMPMVTVRQLPSGSRVVWFGGDRDKMFTCQEIRTMFRQAITWTSGWLLYKTWENKGIMRIDDIGAAESAWQALWHYPALTEEQIVKNLITPLQEHNAILNINMAAGFASEEKRRTELSFNQVFTDAFGTKQDNISTKRGLMKGLAAGVFCMQTHGFTHMLSDLSSPPTWYGANIYKEKIEVGWYREFGDMIRHKEVPAAQQMFLMKTAQEWTKYLFGVEPLSFSAGGGGASIATYENNTHRIAGKAGYGWSSGYAGPDMVVRGWAFQGTKESPYFVGAPPDGHDQGIVNNPEGFLKVFKDYPNVQFISFNEYIGYLHADNKGILNLNEKSLTVSLKYDQHYCAWFNDHPSQWKLEISDWLLEKGNATGNLSIDGEKQMIQLSTESNLINIPKGSVHTIKLSF